MTELVTISINNHIADVRLNRPEKYNALSSDMIQSLANAIETLSKAQGVRVVVVSGEGRGFCAGLDIENFAALQSSQGMILPDLEKRYKDRMTNIFQHIAYGWKELPMPVIAAIHGFAAGGGLQIALGADIRLCSPSAKLSIMEMKWGLIPDMSITQTIRDLVPIDVAKELIFTGRMITGEEAVKLKLVTRTCENPFEESMVLAGEIASKSPDAIRASKKLLNEVWHGDSARGFILESELMMSLLGTPNQLEAISANFKGVPPEFKDPA